MRKSLIIVACCIVALLGSYSAYRGYKVWKSGHMLRLAREFAAKSDMRNAMISLDQALKANFRNVDATRMMADISESSHSPVAVLWRSRVVELNPHSTIDRLAMVKTALGVNDIASATNALYGIDQAGRQTHDYQIMAGAVALATHQLDEAEKCFAEAVRLEPKNPISQLNLAVVKLHATNSVSNAEARTSLKTVAATATNSSIRCSAIRELIGDALRQKQPASALSYSKQLLSEKEAGFTDQLLNLDVLREAQSSEFKSVLTGLQKDAVNDSVKVYQVASWQASRNFVQDALSWLTSLPASIQTNQSVALLTAECRVNTKDWRGLQASLEKQNWKELEFVRHALLARALRAMELPDASKTQWELALKGANQKEALRMLLNSAMQWGWRNQGEEILWMIVNRYPDQKWAAGILGQALMESGQTRSLLTFFNQELKRSPDSIGAKNNLAMVALLLEARELSPHELARQVYQNQPTNPAYVSTYALSLYLQKKSSEALKAMEKLKPEELQYPSIAGYYGLVLQSTGNRANAKKYLDTALKSPLLPEERKLFQQAAASL